MLSARTSTLPSPEVTRTTTETTLSLTSTAAVDSVLPFSPLSRLCRRRQIRKTDFFFRLFSPLAAVSTPVSAANTPLPLEDHVLKIPIMPALKPQLDKPLPATKLRELHLFQTFSPISILTILFHSSASPAKSPLFLPAVPVLVATSLLAPSALLAARRPALSRVERDSNALTPPFVVVSFLPLSFLVLTTLPVHRATSNNAEDARLLPVLTALPSKVLSKLAAFKVIFPPFLVDFPSLY